VQSYICDVPQLLCYPARGWGVRGDFGPRCAACTSQRAAGKRGSTRLK